MHGDTEADLVIGLDSSTQSTKAIAWDRQGHAVAEGRAPIAMTPAPPGHSEQDPEAWWQAACTALREVCGAVGARRIAALAISNQRETVAIFDAQGQALHPAITWLDERAVDEIAPLAEAVGRERIHALTGKPVDIIPVAYRLAWMRRHRPEVMARAAQILDVHGFLTGRLTGRAVASWTSADPFGCFDIAEKRWSEPVLAALGLRAAQFADLARPGDEIGAVTPAAAQATGLAAGTPVVAGGGDGQCAGLGVDAARAGTVYLNLGTALITGAWSAGPQIALTWRTMTSPTGDGYFLEGCQRAGTFLVDWFVDVFAAGAGPDPHATLSRDAALVPVGCEGLTMSPYLSGCMDPHWDPTARAAFEGLAPHHRLPHVYRAVLEALTLESARTIAAMRAAGLAPERIVAVGGGAQNPLWLQMYADATGLPVSVNQTVEASSLGAAATAAAAMGWHASPEAAARAMSREAQRIAPDPAAAGAWAEAAARQASSYRPSQGTRP